MVTKTSIIILSSSNSIKPESAYIPDPTMTKKPKSPESVLPEPETVEHRGELIVALHLQDISPSAERVTSINGHDVIGSYSRSWSQPEVIYVPGDAPVLNLDFEIPMKLPPVNGAFKCTNHRDSSADFNLESALLAAKALDDDFNFSDIDVLIGAQDMWNLFGFVYKLVPRIGKLRLFLEGQTLIVEGLGSAGAETEPNGGTRG